MTEDKFVELQRSKSDTLKASFYNETSCLDAHGTRIFSHFADRNTLLITVSQEAPCRSIEITSETPIKAKQLLETLLKITRLCMLFDGEFLKLKTLEFHLKDKKTDWSDELTQECRERRMLSYYSSADFTKGSRFMCPLCSLSDTLLNKWLSIEGKLLMIHPMALIGMSSLDMPVDLKAAILIETFEPLLELLLEHKHHIKQKLNELKQKYQGKKDQKTAHLQQKLACIMLEYGQDIFGKENPRNDEYQSFCKILANSRHRMFHITRKELFLDGTESALYAAKLSILYRKVLLDILGVDHTLYSENLKSIVSEWDNWCGIADAFSKKIYSEENAR